MAVNPDEDTEFNDALRKHGILPPKEKPPPSPSPPPSPTLEEELDDLTLDELKDLEEDTKNEDTERLIEQFRQKRLEELKKFQHARYGRMYPIGRDDYTREVTEASKQESTDGLEGKGTGVVCFLYKDGIPRSDRTSEHLQILAQRHPHTKFVSIVGDKCIPNLPDSRIPMLIVYRKGEVINQIVAWGADRERQKEELEAVLILAGAIVPQQMAPTQSRRRDESDDEDEDSDDEPSSRMRSAGTRTNRSTGKNIRKKEEDSDSDFDL